MIWKFTSPKKAFLKLIWSLAWPVLTLLILWSAAALWFDGPSARWLAGLLAFAVIAGSVALFFLLRPTWKAMLAVTGVFLVVLIWWNLIPPSNDRDWIADVARTAHASIDGDQMTVDNIRNFDYRTTTDWTERWETRTYDLSHLRGVDMFLSFWGPTLIAHTIVSWDFGDGQHLAISIETRKEKGESYSAVRGFFRQFEVYYVVADERDLIRLRTGYRGERVYLYHLRASPEAARALLLEYMREINRLHDHARWYNALTHNCTTTIRYHALNVGPRPRWDYRLLANGKIDELGYERGTIDTSLPFAELKARSDITDKAKAANDAPDFSTRIREGLPGQFPPPSVQ